MIENDETIKAIFNEEVDVEYTDEAKIAPESEADNIDKVSVTRDEITFKEKTLFVEDLKEGDVLVVNHAVSGAEEGLLKRITEISQDRKTAKVEPAMLDDVIESGDISVTKSISFDYMMENMEKAEGVRILEVDKQNEKFSFEKEITKDVKIEGYIAVEADTEVGLDLKFRERRWLPDAPSGIKEFEFYFIPGFETKKSLTVGDSVKWDNDYDSIEFSGPPIPIYGPVTITPRISLVAGAEGEVGAEMYTEASYDRYYRAGFYYHHDSGWERVLREEGEGFQFEEPSLKGFASARVYTGPDLMGSAGVAYTAEAGLGVSVYGNIKAEGEVQPYPSWMWSYDVKSFVEAGLFANLELVRIASIDFEGPSERFLEKNIAYGVSGYINSDGEGLEDVKIDFESDSFIGSSEASITCSDGYWSKHLLSGEVIATPSKDGYYFEPESKIIAGSKSNVNFNAFLKDEPIEEYTLTIETEGFGSTNPAEGSHIYNEDETVNISAVPDEGWEFSHWEGDVTDSESADTTVTLNDDKTIIANFIEEDELSIKYEGRILVDGDSPGKAISVEVAGDLSTEIETDSTGYFSITSTEEGIQVGDEIRLMVSSSRNYDTSDIDSLGLSSYVHIRSFQVEEGEWNLPELDLYKYGLDLVQPEGEETIESFPYNVEISTYTGSLNQTIYWLYFSDLDGNYIGDSSDVFDDERFNFDGTLVGGDTLDQDASWYLAAAYEEGDYLIEINTFGTYVYLENDISAAEIRPQSEILILERPAEKRSYFNFD